MLSEIRLFLNTTSVTLRLHLKLTERALRNLYQPVADLGIAIAPLCAFVFLAIIFAYAVVSTYSVVSLLIWALFRDVTYYVQKNSTPPGLIAVAIMFCVGIGGSIVMNYFRKRTPVEIAVEKERRAKIDKQIATPYYAATPSAIDAVIGFVVLGVIVWWVIGLW